jgi:hypothetical protein
MRTATEEAWDQIFLLSLFAGSDEPLDNLKVQKVVFISEDEARRDGILAAHFPFYRNKFGPYSPVLANDVRRLEDCTVRCIGTLVTDSENRETSIVEDRRTGMSSIPALPFKIDLSSAHAWFG